MSRVNINPWKPWHVCDNPTCDSIVDDSEYLSNSNWDRFYKNPRVLSSGADACSPECLLAIKNDKESLT